MKRILTKKEKIILYGTLSAVIFSLAGNIVILPLLKKNADLNKKTEITRLKLIKYTRLLKHKESIQEKYNRLPGILSLPRQEDKPAVLGLPELESLAKAAGIRIVDIRPQSARQTGHYREMAIDIKTEGSMQEYLKFIYDLEHSLSLLAIKKIRLSSKPDTLLLEGAFTLSRLSVPE